LDRLMAALRQLGVVTEHKTTSQALVVSLGNIPRSVTLQIAAELRAGGIRTEAYFVKKKKMRMGDQLSHADHLEIPIAVIVAEDELARGEVAIKDLVTGKLQREGIDDREA